MKTSNIRKLTALPLDAAGKPLSSNGQTPTFIRTSYKFSGSASQQVCRPMTTKCNYPTGSQKNCDSLLLTTTLSHLSRFERFYTVLTKNKYIFDTVIVKVFFPTHRSVLRLSAKSVWWSWTAYYRRRNWPVLTFSDSVHWGRKQLLWMWQWKLRVQLLHWTLMCWLTVNVLICCVVFLLLVEVSDIYKTRDNAKCYT